MEPLPTCRTVPGRPDKLPTFRPDDTCGLVPVSRYVPGGSDSWNRPSSPVTAVNSTLASFRATTHPGKSTGGVRTGPPTRKSVPVTTWRGSAPAVGWLPDWSEHPVVIPVHTSSCWRPLCTNDTYVTGCTASATARVAIRASATLSSRRISAGRWMSDICCTSRVIRSVT
jgi:hypothetical protein